MLGKVSLNLPRTSGNYELLANEDCDDSENISASVIEREKYSGKTHIYPTEDDACSIYHLPPSATASLCLPPNPDPPPFNVLAEPITIETRSSLSSLQNVDPFYADSITLQKEILSPGGVEIYTTAFDLLENVAVIELKNNLWIGGWNPRVLNLHSLLHLGDMLVSVNGRNVRTQHQFKKVIKDAREWAVLEKQRTPGVVLNSTDVKCRLRLRRLPLAKTLIVCRQVQDQKIGISFDDSGTNKVKSIDPSGPLACTGLPPLAPSFSKKSFANASSFLPALRSIGRKQACALAQLVPWTATEINHRLLNPFFKQHEADLLIGARGMEISVTLQPSDFMEALCRKVRKLKDYQTFF